MSILKEEILEILEISRDLVPEDTASKIKNDGCHVA
jgi:hypothetical protein